MTNSLPLFFEAKTPISVAIVGLGRAGWHLHLEPIRKLPGFQIVAVVDPDDSRCSEAVELTGCQKFSTLEAALAKSDALLFVIATPSTHHYPEALQVLNAGRHCILEKPMAMNMQDAEKLVTLAKQKHLGLFVNHSHLHMPEFHHLNKVLKSGVLGTLFHIRAFWGLYARRSDWQTLRKNGGGGLNNTCPHVLSIVLPLLGAPVTRVYSDLRNIKDAGDAEDHVHLVLQAPAGVTADIVVSTACAFAAPRWMLFGKNGTLECDGQKSRLRYYDAVQVASLKAVDTAAPRQQSSVEKLPWQEKELPVEPDPVKAFHENVHDVLRGLAEPIVTPESAVDVMRVIEMAYEADRENPVHLQD